MEANNEYSTRSGTMGGTLLVLLLQISTDELMKTAVLAALGATVSFFVSMGWKYMVRKLKRP